MIKITITHGDDFKDWDRYVENHTEGSVFQTSAWRHVVQSTYGHQPFYLAAKREDEICGVLPLFFMNSFLFGRVLASSPYASSGAVCADDEKITELLTGKAIELSREVNAKYLELKSAKITNCDGLQRHSDYLNYQLNIEKPEMLWRERLKKDTREAIRRAERTGLTAERGHHLLDPFYQVMARNMRKLGTPVHSQLFYRTILAQFGPNSEILAVRWKSAVISAVLLLRYRREVVALSAASLPEHLRLRPNNLLYWEAFKHAHSSGATSFDFGRSLVGSGQAKFKESFGAEPHPIYYEYYLNGRTAIPRIHQENPRYRLARAVWMRMPLFLTKWLGPHLIKNIP